MPLHVSGNRYVLSHTASFTSLFCRRQGHGSWHIHHQNVRRPHPSDVIRDMAPATSVPTYMQACPTCGVSVSGIGWKYLFCRVAASLRMDGDCKICIYRHNGSSEYVASRLVESNPPRSAGVAVFHMYVRKIMIYRSTVGRSLQWILTRRYDTLCWICTVRTQPRTHTF